MKLAVMQPYFAPYLGYYALAHYVDRWVFFDTVQYIRHGWINRNRILKPREGWQYVTVPVRKQPRETAIRDIVIDDSSEWRRRLFGQLTHYKKRARYYDDVVECLHAALDLEEPSLARLNARVLATTFQYLGVEFRYEFFSEMDLSLGEIHHPGDWALEISKALGASEYLNPPGGKEIFDAEAFARATIPLTFLRSPLPAYSQRRDDFIPGLSILDALMFNAPETIRSMLAQVELETATPVSTGANCR